MLGGGRFCSGFDVWVDVVVFFISLLAWLIFRATGFVMDIPAEGECISCAQ